MNKVLLNLSIIAFFFVNTVSIAQTKTSSGLIYEIIEKTDGPTPKKGQEVKVKLNGFLMDGTVFQDPAKTSLQVGQKGFLPGFLEAIELLKEGETGMFTLPPKIGYGEKGAKNEFDPSKYDVPPNATIKFEISLLKIK